MITEQYVFNIYYFLLLHILEYRNDFESWRRSSISRWSTFKLWNFLLSVFSLCFYIYVCVFSGQNA